MNPSLYGAFVAFALLAQVSAPVAGIVCAVSNRYDSINRWYDLCIDVKDHLPEGTEVYLLNKGPDRDCKMGAGLSTYYWISTEDGAQGWVSGNQLNCDISQPYVPGDNCDKGGMCAERDPCRASEIRSPWSGGCLPRYKVYAHFFLRLSE